jgi:hypothetical protein
MSAPLAYTFEEFRVGGFWLFGFADIEYDRGGCWSINDVSLKTVHDESGDEMSFGAIPKSDIVHALMQEQADSIRNEVMSAIRDQDADAERGCAEYHYGTE